MPEQNTPIKRQTAYLCTAAQITQGSYIRREGWEPSYQEIDGKMYSRVRLAGVIVEVTPTQLVIDDSTGTVPLRVFDGRLPQVTIGDVAIVIGRPRSFNEETFVLAEVVKKLADLSWVEYYKQNLQKLQSYVPVAPQTSVSSDKPFVDEQRLESSSSSTSVQEDSFGVRHDKQGVPAAPLEDAPKQNNAQKLIELIRELDPGDGAPVDDVLAQAGFDAAEAKLQFLISEGEIFELRAGKVKVLE